MAVFEIERCQECGTVSGKGVECKLCALKALNKQLMEALDDLELMFRFCYKNRDHYPEDLPVVIKAREALAAAKELEE